jgi:transcriptional regulator with XRE-family HTH domain
MNRSQVHSRSVAFTESVSARVRDELKTQDVSFRELARRMGVSIAYVSRRLSDDPEVHFRVDELEKVAAALSVPVARFVRDRPTGTAAGVS